MRAIIRGFDIIIEKLYDCKLSFKIAKMEPMLIDTSISSHSYAQGVPTFPFKRTYAQE